jgi:CheY-like chemotaxis protein/HPt (histidine-containing phosphotransfer) domain-containing protein
MPYINGIETIRMLKSKLESRIEKLPVILLHSSLDNNGLEKECLDLGIRFRLSKPVKSNDLFLYLNNLHHENKTSPSNKIIQSPKVDNIHENVKILIAEDTFLNMVLIKAILSELGFNNEIIEAKNGIEAIEKYQKMSPDLILMDVHMPELDGISATKKIREIELLSGKNVPIIALTAGAIKEDREMCFGNGMNDFLTKPLVPEKIMAMLNKYLVKGEQSNKEPNIDDAEIELHIDYDELLNLFSNKAIIKEIMTVALKDMPVQILELEDACKEKHPGKVSSASHKIKGSSISMRFSTMATIAEKLENSSHDNWNDNLDFYLTELKAEWEIIKKIIHQKLN